MTFDLKQLQKDIEVAKEPINIGWLTMALMGESDVQALFQAAIKDKNCDLKRLTQGLKIEAKKTEEAREMIDGSLGGDQFEREHSGREEDKWTPSEIIHHAQIGATLAGREVTAADILREAMAWDNQPYGHCNSITFKKLGITPAKLFPELDESRKRQNTYNNHTDRAVGQHIALGVLAAVEEKHPGLLPALASLLSRMNNGDALDGAWTESEQQNPRGGRPFRHKRHEAGNRPETHRDRIKQEEGDELDNNRGNGVS